MKIQVSLSNTPAEFLALQKIAKFYEIKNDTLNPEIIIKDIEQDHGIRIEHRHGVFVYDVDFGSEENYSIFLLKWA